MYEVTEGRITTDFLPKIKFYKLKYNLFNYGIDKGKPEIWNKPGRLFEDLRLVMLLLIFLLLFCCSFYCNWIVFNCCNLFFCNILIKLHVQSCRSALLHVVHKKLPISGPTKSHSSPTPVFLSHCPNTCSTPVPWQKSALLKNTTQ